MITPSGPANPFSDLDDYLALPRIGGLLMSPDGKRLVVGVTTADRERNRDVTALWEVDPEGTRPARRLTRGTRGASAAAFTPTGDLLFVSARPDPDSETASTALWLQPADGGDAHVIAAPAGGVSGVVVSECGTVVFGSAMLPSAVDVAGDTELQAKRRDAGVTAILHEGFPIRFWDHDLGPARTRLLTADLTDDVVSGEARLDLRDVTGHVGRALSDESAWDLTPDGRTVVASWEVAEPGGSQRHALVAIDVASGDRRTLADTPGRHYDSPRVSPDGTRVAVVVHQRWTQHEPHDVLLGVVAVDGGELRTVAADWDRWPHSVESTPDGSALVVTADDQGRSPLWRVDVDRGKVTRLTPDGAYTSFHVSPDGRWVYALRAAVDSPPLPVRVALDGSLTVEPLPGPAPRPALPGRLEEVTTTAEDGTSVRGWLVLPHRASAQAPAPLLLWIHGGPVMSANSWSWRWNPWLAAARGYAVLLPDFALSSGYGREFVRRGWGQWGGTPYDDLMSITDAAQLRTDIDPDRAAAMGASFGGYIANWIAGHTDRFAAIVTHASTWNLNQGAETADLAYDFCREMTPEAAEANSPHRFADAITTPMLVTHGDKDYRVPIGEALRLWWDLSSRSPQDGGSSPHKLLYFPDENHFILAPNHVKLFYATVFAFLAHHVRGEEWRTPELLG